MQPDRSHYLLVSFVTATWCQHWFEYFPNPPINVLGMVENALAYHDKELLQHFIRHGLTSQVSDAELLDPYQKYNNYY